MDLVSTPSGVRYGDIAPGCGPLALPGQQVTIQYTAWLNNGKEFDTSRQPGRSAFTFTPGSNGALPGFSYSFNSMRVGGYRRVVIPPALAFGSSGVPPVIPPDATIVVDIQLMAISCGPPSGTDPKAPC
ncbi:MAG TPA: FKBP-type peptidyl-prolyl cis-trans isomerase [Candidatus Dormibacteraeota bacterium]|nr:FKBP-type peptidyl-prolyl cis-trans isomerase [Candidatus Dormibacteraeota bacterium]